jgi:hypothetical protein
MTSPNLAKLPQGWEKILAEEYQAGASDVEVMARLRMTKGMFDELYGDPISSHFKQVVDFGRMLAKAWWYRQGRTNLNSRQFNGNLWYQIMKNRYGWSEKTTTSTKDSEDMGAEELDNRIAEAIKKFQRVVKV